MYKNLILSAGLALAMVGTAHANDSTALPCNSLCQWWMGTDAPVRHAPPAITDLHPQLPLPSATADLPVPMTGALPVASKTLLRHESSVSHVTRMAAIPMPPARPAFKKPTLPHRDQVASPAPSQTNLAAAVAMAPGIIRPAPVSFVLPTLQAVPEPIPVTAPAPVVSAEPDQQIVAIDRTADDVGSRPIAVERHDQELHDKAPVPLHMTIFPPSFDVIATLLLAAPSK